MKIQYFRDTDTLYIELTSKPVAETVDLNENTLFDLDDEGNLVAITLEHAQGKIDVYDFSFQQVTELQSVP